MTTSKKHAAKRKVTAAEFDQAFERGEGFDALDLASATVRSPLKRINLDIPVHILHQIDNEANRIGVPRTSVIKVWIYEKLQSRSIDMFAASRGLLKGYSTKEFLRYRRRERAREAKELG